METVPFDFCQRVAATWKCCDGGACPVFPYMPVSAQCNCVLPKFSCRKWTFAKTENYEFKVTCSATEWTYSFRFGNFRNELTWSDLLDNPDFQKVRISTIQVNGIDTTDRKPENDVELEKLLKFVSLLANEPKVWLYNDKFSSPEGALLLKWLEERCFSVITFSPYQPIFERVLQKQLSRRIPTALRVIDFNEGADFVAKQLATGRATRLYVLNANFFAAGVMKGIIQSFLESSSEKMINISAFFGESTDRSLRKMERDGWCARVDGKFVFENPFQRLEISVNLPVPGRLSRYSIVSCCNHTG